MLTMDRAHLTFVLRRPRTRMCCKPRSGSYLFLELDKINGIAFQGQNGSKPKVATFENRERDIGGSFDTVGKLIKQKQRRAAYTSDLNQLGRDGHIDKANCKLGIPNRTPKSERIVTPRFSDNDFNENAFRYNSTASRGHHSSKNVLKKCDTEHVSRAKLEPDRHGSKPVLKRAENKPAKIVGSAYAQETSDKEDTCLGGQSSPESERNKHGNHCLVTPRHLNGTEGQQVRKSSRVPKKRIFDDEEEEPIRKQRKWLQVGCSAGNSSNAEHDEEMDLAGDESEQLEKEYQKRHDMFGASVDEKKDSPLTARQRALQLSKEGGELPNCNNGASPDELQPVLPRKQKESLSEAEQAIKKEEAAKRRKQQMERNAKEIQASAIQKILGQESSRKKREEKLQKQRQEIEQERQAALLAPAVNSIRWVMGPSGNSVSFSQDVELPKIFSGPCSYPQEREKCVGPSCKNVYKYRDAKTRLPLCSLQCYRAVQQLPSTVV